MASSGRQGVLEGTRVIINTGSSGSSLPDDLPAVDESHEQLGHHITQLTQLAAILNECRPFEADEQTIKLLRLSRPCDRSPIDQLLCRLKLRRTVLCPANEGGLVAIRRG